MPPRWWCPTKSRKSAERLRGFIRLNPGQLFEKPVHRMGYAHHAWATGCHADSWRRSVVGPSRPPWRFLRETLASRQGNWGGPTQALHLAHCTVRLSPGNQPASLWFPALRSGSCPSRGAPTSSSHPRSRSPEAARRALQPEGWRWACSGRTPPSASPVSVTRGCGISPPCGTVLSPRGRPRQGQARPRALPMVWRSN